MEEYLNKLYSEYKKATTIKDNLLDQESFYMWLKERSMLVKKYADFIDNLGIEGTDVVEINKGGVDSVCKRLSELGFQTLAATNYYNTFNLNADVSKSLILIKDGLPYISGRLVTALVTQLPIDNKLMNQLKILSSGTQIILGTYGNSLDDDKKENIKNLKLYESVLELTEEVSIKSKYTDNGDIYMGAVISKPKQYLLDKYPLRSR